MIIAFIPCRLQSSRLPEKAIKQIHGVTAIERCLINSLAINGIDKVVLATSTNPEDDILEKYNLNGKVDVVRGSENDVLSRFFPTIEKYRPEHIIRITGDCPLVSDELGNILIQSHLETNADATYTASPVALGISLEVYKTKAVRKLRELFTETNHSEYLIYYFQNNPDHFKLNSVAAPAKFLHNWRLTLDEANDLELFNLIYKTLDIKNTPVSFDEIIHFFNQFPEAARININNVVKYKQNQELISFLKKATTYAKNEVL